MTIVTHWSDADQGHVATCSGYPSLSWIEDDAEAARVGLFALIDAIEREMQP